jgi:hypothetical protein
VVSSEFFKMIGLDEDIKHLETKWHIRYQHMVKFGKAAFVLYLIMIHVDIPVLEILWEWRAFAIKVDPNIYRSILDLPLKGW